MALSLTPSRISKRVAAALVALALAIAAPVALAASTSGSSGVVHAYMDRSGSTVVSGYDGGVALAPSTTP
jgi:hypothetical protein